MNKDKVKWKRRIKKKTGKKNSPILNVVSKARKMKMFE